MKRIGCLLAFAGALQAAEPPPSLPSCAGSGPAIVFAPNDSRTLLDAGDQRQVLAAMLDRYPVLQRDGFEARHLVLWRRGSEWLYVAVQQRETGLCFSATFVGAAFEFTPVLVRKYFTGA